MLGLTRGKRMLKAALLNQEDFKKRRMSPDSEAQFFCEAGLDKNFNVKYISDYKGFGVFSVTPHTKGDFLLQYAGERISKGDGLKRMEKSTENRLFFYVYNGEELCIDAEGAPDRICQYVNDSNRMANSVMKLKVFKDRQYLCLYALKDITPDEEILYNYGDEENLWWRSKKNDDPFEFVPSDIDSDPFSVSNLNSSSESADDLLYSDASRLSDLHYIPDSSNNSIDSEIVPYTPLEGLSALNSSRCQEADEASRKTKEVHMQDSEKGNDEELGKDASRLSDLHYIPDSLNNSIDSEIVPHTPLEGLSALNNSRCQEADEASRKTKKPERYCVYCKETIKGGKLRRHIIRKHKSEEDVKAIMQSSRKEQNLFFERKRREGIYDYNLEALAEEKELMRERKPKNEDNLRVCSSCKSFLSNRYFSKHVCENESRMPLKPKLISSQSEEVEKDSEFKEILSRFRDGEVGDLCRSEKIIIQIGYRHFNLRRHESSKRDEVRKVVMGEMRQLARLYLAFKNSFSHPVTVEDMFSRSNLTELREAIESLVAVDKSEQQEKHGLKLMLDAIILRSVKALSGYYSETMQDSKYKELKMFKVAYKHRSNEMYSSARHQCNKISMEKSRKPENLPSDAEMANLNNFIQSEIKETVECFTLEKYAWLRSLIVARLTLYNARRGEEPARMLVKEWTEALADTWLPQESVQTIEDEAEKYLLGQYKLVYIGGKGRKFVSILVPNDVHRGITLLLQYRNAFGITESNKFIFATKSSASHCSGWHAVSEISSRCGVVINATTNRHRLSTMYASLDMSPSQRQIFLDHMGHAESINKDNYQCPQGVRTVLLMGKMLDGCTTKGKLEVHSNPETECTNTGESIQAIEEMSMNVGKEKTVSTNTATVAIAARTRKSSVKWSKKDTALLIKHFRKYMQTKQLQNKGDLPGKKEITDFLEVNTLLSISHLPIQDQYSKIRTKLFNERKTMRLKVNEKLKQMEVE